MGKALYEVVTGTAAGTALTAATANWPLGVKADNASGLDLVGFAIAFNGVTATNVPVLVEVCRTNYTGGTAFGATVTQVGGRDIPWGSALGLRAFATEPTVLTPLAEFLVTPNNGQLNEFLSLGKGFDCDPTHGFALRVTPPNTVSCQCMMLVERV